MSLEQQISLSQYVRTHSIVFFLFPSCSMVIVSRFFLVHLVLKITGCFTISYEWRTSIWGYNFLSFGVTFPNRQIHLLSIWKPQSVCFQHFSPLKWHRQTMIGEILPLRTTSNNPLISCANTKFDWRIQWSIIPTAHTIFAYSQMYFFIQKDQHAESLLSSWNNTSLNTFGLSNVLSIFSCYC